MKNTIVCILLALVSLTAYGQHYDHYIHDPNASAREHVLDITHMKLDVEFKPIDGIVKGRVIHTFSPIRKKVDSVFWDAPGIKIEKAEFIQGKSISNIRFNVTDKGVTTYFDNPISWDNEYQIAFTYTATPKRGIYFIGWGITKINDRRNQTRQQIWTQGQGIDNRHWIPMYDNPNDKFVTETVITFLKDFNVLSNGELLSSTENDDNTKTWHYRMPHPHAGYLLMIAIDRYAIKKTTTSRNTPVEFWYYPEHEDKLEYTSMHTEKMIEFLEDETGFPYPWGKYSQVMVQDFMYGAMENTSATIFGDFFNVDEYSFNDRNYIGVNAHELTHQWFGDLITARSRTGTWLQESFATYYAKLFMKELYGDDEYRWNMRGEVTRSLAATKIDNNPIVHSRAGTTRVYPKGSSVLHMLRYVIGDEEYKRVIKHYLEKHAYGNVITSDLNLAVQDVLGLSMDWFFDQWLYRGGEPHYKVTYSKMGDQIQMRVDQIQQNTMTIGNFKMPINCGVYYTDGTNVEKQVWIQDKTHLINFKSAGKELAYVLFDVNSEIIKDVTFEKPTKMWLAQLAGAKNMIDRYDALMALSDISLEKKKKALFDALKQDNHHGIKSEIVKQLANDKRSAKELMKCLEEEDVRVRRSLLTNAKDVTMYQSFFESALTDKSYINIHTALTKLIENSDDNGRKHLDLTKDIIGHNHDIRITWLGYKLIKLRKDSAELMRDKSSIYYTYMNELTLYSSSMYEFRTRIKAMEAIRKFNFLSAPAIQNIFEACLSKNSRLAGPSKSILLKYHDQYELQDAIQQVFDQLNYTEEQKKKLRDMGLVR